MKVVSSQRSVVSKKVFCFALCALLSALCSSAAAKQAKTPKIGYVAGGASSVPAGFVQGWRDLGYFDEKNIVIECHSTNGKSERRFDLNCDLLRLVIVVLVAEHSVLAVADKRLTETIPFVM